MSIAERTKACRVNFGLFLAYYFPHYIHYQFADHHYEMIEDIHDLIDLKIRELAWFMYRESAKTSFAKCFIIFMICYEIDHYLNADAYDKDNSERTLFDVVVELQSNQRIIADFGQLYNAERTKGEATQKRITDFVTNARKNDEGLIESPGIRVEAHSTQEPVRGRIHGAMRPGFALLDDFETSKTVGSPTVTKSIGKHIDEFKLGLDTRRRRTLYLGNYFSEHGNIHQLIEKAKVDHELRVRIVPIMDGEGNPTWPQKYCKTDKEAEISNKISLQSLKRSSWSPEEGDAPWEGDMMMNPIDYTKAIFRRELFQTTTYEKIKSQQTVAYVTIDPPGKKEGNGKKIESDKRKKKADYAGFTINWVNKENKWHFKAWRKKIGPSQLLAEMFDIHQFLINMGTPCVRMGWEDTQYTRGLEVALRRMMRERNVFLPMAWLSPKGRNKEDRIRSGLLYRYEINDIYHLENECHDLEKELTRFPEAENDDCSDSASYQADLAKPPGKERGGNRQKQLNALGSFREEDEEEEDTPPQFQDINL